MSAIPAIGALRAPPLLPLPSHPTTSQIGVGLRGCHPKVSVLIYLTQCRILSKNISSRDRVFAIFLLLCLLDCVTRAETGCVSVLSTDAALTTNHLPLKGESWLPTSLANARIPISAFSPSLRQRARSLPKWSFQSHLITESSKSFSQTKLPCASIWNRESKSPLSLSVGSLEVTNHANAGDLSSASNFSKHQNKPAFSGRVFSSGLVRGSPEEYGGQQLAECGGVR